MSQIYYFQDLMVGDARMHKTGCHMNREAKTCKSAPPFKSAGYVVGKGDLFSRDTQDHLSRFYDYIIAVFHMNNLGYILKMRIIFYVIDL